MQQLNWTSPLLASLRPLLLPPDFPNDEDKTRLARGVHSVLLATSLIALLFSIAILLLSEYKLTGLASLAITFGTMLPLILLNYRGKTRLVSIIYLIYFWVLISVTLLVSGGLFSIVGILYIPMIALALLFLGWRASLASCMITLIYIFTLATTNLSYLPDYFPPTTLSTWFVLTIGIVIILTPIYQMQRELITTLYNARKQLAERQKTEDILKGSEERFRLISSISSDYTFSTRFDGPAGLEHTVYGGAFETITGYTPEEFDKVGGWLTVVHPDDLAQDAGDMAVLRQNKTVISELRIIRKDGQVRWVRTYGYPIWDAAGQKLLGLYGAVQDINERKLAEQALQESEERFRLISSITSDYTYVSRFNTEGKLQVKIVTGAFSTITGYTQEEFVELGGWLAILHPDDLEKNARDMEKLRRNESVVTEVRIFNKSGELRWVRMYGYPVWDTANNQLIGANGAVQDITDRKLAEEALVESENRYRLVSETISDYAYAYDIHPDGSFTAYWITEDSFMRLTGHIWIEIATTFNLYHPDDARRAEQDVQQTIAGNATSGEYRIITKSGETRWVSIKRKVEWDENEKRFVRFYGAAQDITERKQAENAFAQERKLLRTVIDQQPDNIFVKDRNSKFLLNNTESMRILGVSRQEDLLGKDDFDFVDHELAQKWFESQQQIMRSGQPTINREVFQPWYTDRRRWVLFTSIPLRDAQGEVIGLLGIDRDITEQKRSEEAIREKEAFLRVLLDATTDIVFLMTVDGRFLTVNKPMADSLGMTVEALIGRNGFDFLPPELRDDRLKHFDRCVQTRQPIRWEDRNSKGWWDNTIYPVLSSSGEVESFAVYSVDVTEQKRLAAELQRYATQLEQMVEERTIELRRAKEQIEVILNNTRDAIALARDNGDIETRNPAFVSMFGDQVSNWIERLLWMVTTDEQCKSVGQALVNTIHNQTGQRVELQIVSENGHSKDIDLAFIPVRLTENQDRSGVLVSAHDITHIKQIERFKTQFIDDAVHDLATPITGLMNRLYLLKRSPEKLDDHLLKLENQVGHLRNLLDDLRSLSQSNRGQLELSLEPININRVVARVFDTYEPVAISKGQTLNLITDPHLPEIQLDNRQMERVFVNLVANAINYTPNDKAITVQTALDENSVLFSVADQGIGISPIDLPHIFERFYRAQDVRSTQSSGTGLGLAIVKEIVERHGGSITAASELGKGSTFTVRLPINPDC
jgi:PAS domain S-box-containing protein